MFLVENNGYSMGTSVTRSSKSGDNFHQRLPGVPGLKIDGMNVFEVQEIAKFAKSWAIENGPIVLNVKTYRYHGHSMSDPGLSYRSRKEVKQVRKENDPIQFAIDFITENGIESE